jgi:hypothetical protein
MELVYENLNNGGKLSSYCILLVAFVLNLNLIKFVYLAVLPVISDHERDHCMEQYKGRVTCHHDIQN